MNVDLYNPALLQLNNSFVVGGTGAGSSVQDSILDGYTVPFSTPSSLAPGASMVFALTYGVKALYEYVWSGLLHTNLSIR
ncbi:hypothetical protein J7546_27020, partial [Escherichia coli]|uniref:hypothetical protein n=1 Tax=Escherichia coli TaxID=562 RepID=UPI001AE284AC